MINYSYLLQTCINDMRWIAHFPLLLAKESTVIFKWNIDSGLQIWVDSHRPTRFHNITLAVNTQIHRFLLESSAHRQNMWLITLLANRQMGKSLCMLWKLKREPELPLLRFNENQWLNVQNIALILLASSITTVYYSKRSKSSNRTLVGNGLVNLPVTYGISICS